MALSDCDHTGKCLATELQAEIERLRAALNPRFWTQEQSDAWHRAIPDLQTAFDALVAASVEREKPRPPLLCPQTGHACAHGRMADCGQRGCYLERRSGNCDETNNGKDTGK